MTKSTKSEDTEPVDDGQTQVDWDAEPAAARTAEDPPAPVQSPAEGLQTVDPSLPVGNWGVYPPLDTETSPETGIASAPEAKE